MPRPFIPAANTVSVELFQLTYGVTHLNVIHVQKDTPFTGAQISSLRAAIVTWATPSWKNANAAATTLVRIRTKALDTGSSPMEDYSLPTPIPGLETGGSALPLSSCCALKLSTGLTGRSNRGRLYLPVVRSSWTLNNDVTAAWQTVALTSYNALLAAIPAWNAAAHWVVASFMHDKVWRVAAVLNNVIAIAFVDAHIDCQRRRLTGRGI